MTSWRPDELKYCAVDDCPGRVAFVEGEGRARYARRLCCPAHTRVRVNSTRRAAWRSETRVCAYSDCGERFTPARADQQYHQSRCATDARRASEVKVCACGCGEMVERPPGLNARDWARRRYKDGEHRARGQRTTPSTATAGKRQGPRVTGAKPPRVGGNAQVTQDRQVFAEGPRTAPWRPPAPEVVRVERATPRPSLAAIRRSA